MPSKFLLSAQVFVHHTAAIEIFGCHAHFAMDAFLRVNIVTVADYGNCALSANRLAFKAFPASVKLPDLISNHPL